MRSDMKQIVASISSVGFGWRGTFALGATGTYRAHIGGRITDGIKPVIGRVIEMDIGNADEAEKLSEQLKRIAQDMRFREEQAAQRQQQQT